MLKTFLEYLWGIFTCVMTYLYACKYILNGFPEYDHPDSGPWFLLLSVLAIFLVIAVLRKCSSCGLMVRSLIPFPVGMISFILAVILGNLFMW